MAVSGEEYHRYGGNTSCFQVTVGDHQVIFDCGTGLRSVQHDLGPENNHFVVFLTHYHWDHLQGIPVFAPLYLPTNAFTFYGPEHDERSVRDLIGAVIRPPWFPAAFDESPADIECRPVPNEIDIGPLRIRSIRLTHPDPVVGYRIDGPTQSVVLATDHESGVHDVDAALVELADGADVLIHDGQYTPRDYIDNRIGWGHSTWEHATKAALAAGVGRLYITSHDPDHTDDDVEAIERDARAVFPEARAIREGMRIAL